VAIPPILIGSLASLIRGTGALELAAATARSPPRTTVHIERAASLTVKEGPYGPRFVRDETVSERAPMPGTEVAAKVATCKSQEHP
jgi:hypothetical protein